MYDPSKREYHRGYMQRRRAKERAARAKGEVPVRVSRKQLAAGTGVFLTELKRGGSVRRALELAYRSMSIRATWKVPASEGGSSDETAAGGME